MPDERDAWLGSIKSVEREYQATRFAVDRVLGQVKQDPSLLTGDVRVREIERAVLFLEGTYTIRLFAEFESGLRLFFGSARKRRPPSKTEDLLNSVAARQGIPHERLRNAHTVREYRNDLIHHRQRQAGPLPIAEARGYLCGYFSFLPRHW
jgi:hypothetical protein